MAIKNQSVVVEYIAWDISANNYKTGDVANHTIYNTLDGIASAASNSPAEVDATNRPGLYRITLDADETNGNSYGWGGKSATANIVLFGFFALTERGTVASLGTQVTSVGTLTTSVGVAVASSETILSTANTSVGTLVTSVGTQTNSVGSLTTSVGVAVASSETVITNTPMDLDPDGTTSGKVAAAIAGKADASASGTDRTFSFKEVGDITTEKLNVTVDEDGNRTIN